MGRGLASACLVASLAGCYTGSARSAAPAAIASDPGWTLVRDVPFVAQTAQRDCGAAALAMVLRYWNVPATLPEILAAHPDSRARGLRAGELRDYARARGLEAFVVKGQPADLRAQLDRGRPLIVGLAKPYGPRSLAHYEVVVGANRQARRILTLDPAHGWRENSVEGFAAEWAGAEQVAIVVFRAEAAATPR